MVNPATPDTLPSGCARACGATLRWPVRQVEHTGPSPSPPMVAMPAVPDPPHSLLALCGEGGLRRLVHRHMTRLRLTPLLAEHDGPECFACITERVGDFVIESCGGPLYWSQHHSPHRGVRAGAGWPVLLDEIGREIWLVQLWHSLDDVGLPDALRADVWRWAEPLSLHLLVPRARQTGVRRYPFERVRSWFTPAPPTPHWMP